MSNFLDSNNLNEGNELHVCNELIVIEDNLTTIKKYIKYLKEENIKHKAFLSGNKFLNYIQNSGLLKCKKCSECLVVTD